MSLTRPLTRWSAHLTVCLLAVCSCATSVQGRQRVAGITAPAAAPERGTSGAVADAARQFDLGSIAYANGHMREALEHFEAASGMAPSAAVLFNLARVHDDLRHDDAAARSYIAFLRSEPDLGSASRREALRALTRIAPRVSWVVLRGDAAGMIDGEAASADGVPSVFAPGVRRVELSSGARLSLRLRGGDVVVVECAGLAPPVVSPAAIGDLRIAGLVGRRAPTTTVPSPR